MTPVLARLTKLAHTEQGRRLFEQAKATASDPETRRKIEELRVRLMRGRP